MKTRREEPLQTYKISLAHLHESCVAGLGPGRTPSLCPQLLSVSTATTNPDPAENKAEILLLAPTNHEVQAVHNWEALNLYGCVHTNCIS